ncbi:hypothetical protein EVAR_65822_1 [Eumeta japonica]|uniref:Uncharacterized protein n=1 Tax=Eumeta variegata TaxID=151549 RepID=A0A4C1ZPK5_EUMVA|nr:hypothetical protein EVAR_65822_1 [Eumeta japonica]
MHRVPRLCHTAPTRAAHRAAISERASDPRAPRRPVHLSHFANAFAPSTVFTDIWPSDRRLTAATAQCLRQKRVPLSPAALFMRARRAAYAKRPPRSAGARPSIHARAARYSAETCAA